MQFATCKVYKTKKGPNKYIHLKLRLALSSHARHRALSKITVVDFSYTIDTSMIFMFPPLSYWLPYLICLPTFHRGRGGGGANPHSHRSPAELHRSGSQSSQSTQPGQWVACRKQGVLVSQPLWIQFVVLLTRTATWRPNSGPAFRGWFVSIAEQCMMTGIWKGRAKTNDEKELLGNWKSVEIEGKREQSGVEYSRKEKSRIEDSWVYTINVVDEEIIVWEIEYVNVWALLIMWPITILERVIVISWKIT